MPPPRPHPRFAPPNSGAACSHGKTTRMGFKKEVVQKATLVPKHLGPGLHNNHQNSTRRHPVRDQKSKIGGGRGKKARNFGPFPPHPSGPHLSGPPFGVPLFGARFVLGLGPSLCSMTHTRYKIGLAKIGLAQIGQIRMAKTGLAKVGPFPSQLGKCASGPC